MILRKVALHLKWKFNDLLRALGSEFYAEKVHGEVRVLCFHGICEDRQDFINSRFLKESQFIALLEEISVRFHVLSLDDYLAKDFKKDQLNILLTFGDGYQNNLTLALPILERFQMPATIFCTSQEHLWTDLMDITLNAQKKSSARRGHSSHRISC